MPCFTRSQMDVTAASVMELPVGSSMYLKSTRLMSGIFFIIGLVSLHSAGLYGSESRWDSSRIEDSLGVFATRYSIADYTPADYLGENVPPGACSNHGFSVRVCRKWSTDSQLASYVCGAAPSNISNPSSISSELLDPLSLGVPSCTEPAQLCVCFPGWTGSSCNLTDSLTAKPNAKHPVAAARTIEGWCRPSAADVAAMQGKTLITGSRNSSAAGIANRTDDSNAYCNGRGVCMLRAPTGSRTYNYTFCQCDAGFWGPYCENSDYNSFTSGSSLMNFYNQDRKSSCVKGLVPVTTRNAYILELEASRCQSHGFAAKLPTTSTGKYAGPYSSFYRPQTEGVCVCEPGYAGEQCIGGRAIDNSAEVAVISCITSVLLLLGTLCLYRERKRADYVFDATHITPGDFSLFVDHLPELSKSDIPTLEKFFSKWGAIHSISPGFNDEMLRWWQSRKNDCLRWELIYQQIAAKADEPTPGNTASLMRENAAPHAYRDWVQRLGGVPPLRDGEVAWGAGTVRFMALPIIFENITILLGSWRRQFLAGCEALIAEELQNPETASFERCVITFERTESFENALGEYHEAVAKSNEGVSTLGHLKMWLYGEHLLPENLCFQGKVIHLQQAPEPKEILWDSLDTSPGERSIRKWISQLFLWIVALAMFHVIKNLPTSDPGIVGTLVSIVIVVINLTVVEIWYNVAKYGEQDETEGSQVRGIFTKTLAVQLVVMFAANIGVSGVPFDSKNGYVIDFYEGTAGFMMRTTITEAILPPILSLLAIGWRANLLIFGSTTSKDYRELLHEPPRFLLAERCASFMRIVLMSCAFSSGMPLLYLLTAFVLFNMSIVDTFTLTRIYMISPSGPELARALEGILFFGSIVNVFISWLTMRDGASDSALMRWVLFVLTSVIVWLAASYYTYKQYRKRDCFCGMGFLWLGPIFCFHRVFMEPVNAVNSFFVKIFLGETFYTPRNDAVDETRDHLRAHEGLSEFERTAKRIKDMVLRPIMAVKVISGSARVLSEPADAAEEKEDETGGRTYSQIAIDTPAWELRVHPYCVWERAQLGTWMTPEVVHPMPPPITATHVAFLRTALAASDDAHHLFPDWLRIEILAASKAIVDSKTGRVSPVNAAEFGLAADIVQDDKKTGVLGTGVGA
jgi:hypothetical protein